MGISPQTSKKKVTKVGKMNVWIYPIKSLNTSPQCESERFPIFSSSFNLPLKMPIVLTTGWWFGTFFMFPYIGNTHPIWRLHIFRRGSYSTNQIHRLSIDYPQIIHRLSIYNQWFNPFPVMGDSEHFHPRHRQRSGNFSKESLESRICHLTTAIWAIGGWKKRYSGSYPLVMTNIANWKITMFNGNIIGVGNLIPLILS